MDSLYLPQSRSVILKNIDYMDIDVESIIESLLNRNCQDRNVAIDALYEELRRTNIPGTILDEICSFLIECHKNYATAFIIASTLSMQLKDALISSDYDLLLNEIKKRCGKA